MFISLNSLFCSYSYVELSELKVAGMFRFELFLPVTVDTNQLV